MPNSELLEKFPLYRKCKMDIPLYLHNVPTPPIHMYCEACKSEQTFNIANKYSDDYGHGEVRLYGEKDIVVRAVYLCSACRIFLRFFLVKLSVKGKYAMKVGQEPPYEIAIDKNLSKMLGRYEDYYKKGLICESQSYGIGAYAYFRRIAEEIIDELLESITDLIEEENKEVYKGALEKTKETKVTQDKIDLVKDLLPSSLRPNNVNPLGVLHEVLSEGLHSKSDEECLEDAIYIKDTLIFLVNQILRSEEDKKQFTESMKKLLTRKSLAKGKTVIEEKGEGKEVSNDLKTEG